MRAVNRKTKFLLILWRNCKSFRCGWKVTAFEFTTKAILIFVCRYIFIQGVYLDPIWPLLPGEVNPLINLSILYTPRNAQTNMLMDTVKQYSFIKEVSATVEGMDTSKEILKRWKERNDNNSADTLVVGVIFEEISEKSLEYDIRVADEVDSVRMYIATREAHREVWRKYSAKFITVQRAVESAYISSITKMQVEIPVPEIITKRIDLSTSNKALILARFIAWSGLLICTTFFKNLMDFKQAGGNFYMESLGLEQSLQWIAKIMDVAMKALSGQSIVAAALSLSIRVEWALMWFFLSIFTVNAASFLSFVSVFFRNTNTALVVVFLMWILTSVTGKAFLVLPSKFVSWEVTWVLAFFFPNMNLSLGFLSLCNLERDRILAKGNAEDQHDIGLLIALIPASCAMYITLTLWCDRVWHQERGIGWKCWPFKSRKEISSPRMSALGVADYVFYDEMGEEIPVEKPPLYYYPEIRVRNVSKYNRISGDRNLILDDLTVDIFGNETTFILGENGSGKSTLIGIMMGRLVADEGTVFYGHMDINVDYDLQSIRASIGWCPQESIFLSCLSVRDLLTFAGKLRDLPSKRLEQEIRYLLSALALEDVADKRPVLGSWPESLCRRTTVAMAVIGRPKIIFLDDPTRGVDIDGRRLIWNLLQNLRSNRVIVVATNVMDEVDEFADRVILLKNGKVRCWGSPRYLKNHFDLGFEIEVERGSEVVHGAVEKMVLSHVGDALQRSFRPGLIVFRLPRHAAQQCPSIIRKLKELGVENVGVRVCGMEHMFLKTTKFSERKAPDRIMLVMKQNLDTMEERKYDPLPFTGCCRKFIVLVRKELLMMRRFYSVYLFGALFLAGMLTGVFAICELPLHRYSGADVYRRTKMSAKIYGGIVVYEISPTSTDIEVAYRQLVLRDDGIPQSVTDATEYYKKQEKNDTFYLTIMMHIGARLTWNISKNLLVPGTPLYSLDGVHTPAVSINLLSNAVLRALNFRKVSITVYSNPFPRNVPTLVLDFMGKPLLSELTPLVMVLWLTAFGRPCFLEIRSGSYNAQLRAGATSLVLWSTRLFCHLALHAIVGLLLMVTITIVGSRMYGCPSGLMTIYVIWVLYGYAYIPFIYLMVRLRIQLGFIVIILAAIVISNTVFHQFQSTFKKEMDPFNEYFEYLHYIFSPFVIISALTALFEKLQADSVCRLSRPSLCPLAFGKSATLIKRRECMQERHYMSDIHTRLWQLGLIGTVNFLIVVLLDSSLFHRFKFFIWSKKKSIVMEEPVIDHKAASKLDESVIIERRLAIQAYKEMPSLPRRIYSVLPPAYAIAAKGLWHVDKKGNCLVGDASGAPLSFRVRTGECLGLLGSDPGAAGGPQRKSPVPGTKLSAGAASGPLLSMLAGWLWPWRGDVAGVTARLNEDRRQYLWNVRYTPENQGCLSVLNVEEHIQLFCGLYGLSYMEFLATWGGIFGLWPMLNVQLGYMTPGQRRLVSVMLSFIGAPSLVLMDKPTKGQDPRTRRRVAAAFTRYHEYQHSIVITSNSEEETAALCHRVAWMHAGRIISLGSSLVLNDRFRKGFIVTFDVEHRHRDVTPLINTLDELFGRRMLVENVSKAQRKVRIGIEGSSLKIEDLIEKLEIVRTKVPGAVDYTIRRMSKAQILSGRLIGFLGAAERP